MGEKAPDWLDQPLGGDVAFSGGIFRKGVRLGTLVKAAQRWERLVRQHFLASLPEPDGEAVAACQHMIAASGDDPWCPDLSGSGHLARDRRGDVTINIPTALCWMQFQPGSTTGTDDDTRPGVGFTLVAYPGCKGEWPSGVIPRSEARKLHAMLGEFLSATPEPSP